MRKLFVSVFIALVVVWFTPDTANAQVRPMERVVNAQVGNVGGGVTQVPTITWGGDIATLFGNGNSATTTSGSIFDQQGLDLRLVNTDYFKDQVEAYMRGDSPYLRGTLGMINQALSVLSRDQRTVPIAIYQLTWSAGGDCMVVRPGKTVANIRTIVMQEYGPHTDYAAKMLKDGGNSIDRVNVTWTKDLTGTNDSPAEVFSRDSNADAVMAIIPDCLALTSGGSVGTGSEGSVRGAKIVLSTKSANRIISDVYVVRSDYYASNEEDVQRFVHGLMLSEEALRTVWNSKSSREYTATTRAAGRFLLGSEQATADVEGLYADAEFVGYAGNVEFFTNSRYPRNLTRVTSEIQDSFVPFGLISGKSTIIGATFNYDELRQGLYRTTASEGSRFNRDVVERAIARRAEQGTLDNEGVFSLEIFFRPNQNEFNADAYQSEFDRVIDLASTYGGAIITVEGHSDPLEFLRKKQSGANGVVLSRLKQSGKNLSFGRATSVKQAIVDYAAANGVFIDQNQFSVFGHGISNPATGICGNDPCAPSSESEWLSNMRVVFQLVPIEAEADAFVPLN